MKKIIISLAVIGVVSAVVIGGTIAYFSDTETSVGNTFTAGTIDIAIDNENPWTSHYDIGDLKPGETGYINFDITNEGTNPVNISKTLTSIEGTGGTKIGYTCNNVSVSSEPEFLAESGIISSEGVCSDSGWKAIDDVETQIIYDLSVKVYADSGTTNPIWWQTIYTDTDGKSIADVYGSSGGQYVTLGMIPVGGHMEVTQSYHFNPDAENQYQGDQLSFDITIKGDQMAQVGGYTTVNLENKSGAPAWDVLLGDVVEGTLSYKTMGSMFDYNFTGNVNTTGDYTLIYVGSTNDYPCTDSVVLGTGSFTAGTPLPITGSVSTGDITNGKIWLVPTSSYDGNVMTSWPEADILFETGLINYVQN